MDMTARKLSFKTPDGQEQYLAAYDAVMNLWPIPYESRYIETSHGVTHVIVSGPADAPPEERHRTAVVETAAAIAR